MQPAKIDEIIESYPAEPAVLIQLLLDIQNKYNWIPPEAIRQISTRLQVPVSHIYRIASFYKAMSLIPRGKHVVSVCLGTACHVRGGPKIAEKIESILDVREGETTADMKFSLERVNCLGCCALGPVIMVDKDYHGKLTPVQVKNILESYD